MAEKSHERKDYEAKVRAERLRYGPDHRPVDDSGDSYEGASAPGVPGDAPEMGDDRPRTPHERGTLNPYRRHDAPAGADPQEPKAPPVFQVGDDGKLVDADDPEEPGEPNRAGRDGP